MPSTRCQVGVRDDEVAPGGPVYGGVESVHECVCARLVADFGFDDSYC